MDALITIRFVVPVGYSKGDYARLHGNNGSGDIDWDTPLTDEVFELFPNGGGIFGWGHAPWGHFRWGHAHSAGCSGWGHLPWGHFPWGHGTGVIEATHQISACGDYKYGLTCRDELGNLHEGSPEEVTAVVHLSPAAPTGLIKNSYDKTTKVLVLDAA